MKILIILGLLVISTKGSFTVQDILEEWNLFKIEFNKKYKNDEEELFRKNVYLQNKIKIEEHNELFKKGQVTYKLGMNHFGDLDIHELSPKVTRYNQFLKNDIDQGDSKTFVRLHKNMSIPSSIDWRKKGAVTPVKNQGNKCQSDWAFSSTGALEGQNFLKTGKLVSLSEQNLIDCSRKFHNKGCKEGFSGYAYEYVKVNGGIDTEDSYHYKDRNGICMYKSKNKGATCSGREDISSGNENALAEAVATIGPISVSVDATPAEFHFYKEGVFYAPYCSSYFVNHAMLVVGYNTTESGEDYWIVKNSWGTGWGQQGYVWMARNKNNNCGIANMANYPLV